MYIFLWGTHFDFYDESDCPSGLTLNPPTVMAQSKGGLSPVSFRRKRPKIVWDLFKSMLMKGDNRRMTPSIGAFTPFKRQSSSRALLIARPSMRTVCDWPKFKLRKCTPIYWRRSIQKTNSRFQNTIEGAYRRKVEGRFLHLGEYSLFVWHSVVRAWLRSLRCF